MLHLFTPGNEEAILNGSPHYHPPGSVRQMQKDLAFLPSWYASKGDIVLIEEPLDIGFGKQYQALSEYCVTPWVAGVSDARWLHEQPVSLWGMSPQAISLLQIIEKEHSVTLNLPSWNPQLTRLVHRQTAGTFLQALCRRFSYLDSRLIPQFYHRLEDIQHHVESHGDTLWLAKAPYSSSGRGVLRLPKGALTRTEKQILKGWLRRQREVSIEPLLHKELDFAMEFSVSAQRKCSFVGISLFQTTEKGKYLSNSLMPQSEIRAIITQKLSEDRLSSLCQFLSEQIETHIAPYYQGYMGVDMMCYRTDNADMHVHPCVEINLRTNMGVVSIFLQQKYVHPDAGGHFFISYFSEERGAYDDYLQKMQEHPPIFSDGMMRQGYFPLCPIYPHTKYVAYAFLR